MSDFEFDFYETYDESFSNALDNDFYGLVDEVDYEDYCSEDYELSDDCNSNSKRGILENTYVTASLKHFNQFYHYLLAHGYETMKLQDPFRYKITVFGLTKEDIVRIDKAFLSKHHFVPLQISSQVA